MIRIVVLGTGNVASHIIRVLENTPAIDVIQVYNRSEKGLNSLDFHKSKTTQMRELVEADCYIIAVPDDAVFEVSNAIPFQNRLVVHTSGSVAMNELSSKNRKGVFYPLQTFSKEKFVDFKDIPICLEAHSNEDLILLKKIASSISNSVFEINSQKREQLHLAAVFVCNFVNHLYHIGHEITKKNELPFSILSPLIKETTSKIENNSPENMQTGPAKRNDQKTMAKHIALLNTPIQKELYSLLSNSISTTYGRKKL